MPSGTTPSLFVSSTCYDLAQVRSDLRDFAHSMGLNPTLSEFSTFPVNPSIDAISNCLENVRNNADLFLLIVGGRYGSLTDAGLSVTNLEFLEAIAKGIPTYVFVKQDILTLLPVWKANPEANFSHAVDSPKLFEFVDHLRGKQNLWVFPFATAQEICGTLRQQLGYLFADCLRLRSQMYPPDAMLSALGPSALRTYLEKPSAWEYLTLAHCFNDAVARHRDKRMDLDLGISFSAAIHISDVSELLAWIPKQLDELVLIVSGLDRAMSKGVEPAVGPSGIPGDIRKIIHLSERLGQAYLSITEWALQFTRVSSPEEFATAFRLMSELALPTLNAIELYTSTLYDRVQDALKHAKSGDVVSLTLRVSLPDTAPLMAELRRLTGAA